MALETGGSLYWKTKIDNTGLQTGAVQAKGILRGLTRSITGMDVFAGLAIGATLVFAKITKEVYNFSRNFESAMKEVQTISKAVQNNFKGISKEIIDMSKTVPDNAQKLSKALYQIVSAGYDGAEAMKILRTSAELAVATVTDTFTAADALTYVMNAYGIAAGTAAEISDKLFTIVKLGKVKMEELGPTISMVTGLAAQAGLAFNELAAIYAEAVKKIQPHIVSTGIRGIVTAMLRVSKGTGDAADAAREFGIEFDIAALRSKGFKQILSEIIVATKGNEGALMRLFPNVRGLIGLLAIMTDEGKGFNKTLNEIENSAGATGKAFKIMMETTDNQFAIMKNNIMAKLKPLGDSILGFMNDLAREINISMSGATDEFSRMARAYSDLADTLQRKKNRIDSLIAIIEDLRSKTELTKEETFNLRAAEKSLMILLPDLGKAARDLAEDFDILTEAKRGSLELDIKIIESKLAIAEAEKKRTEIEVARFKRSEDEASKELKRLEEEIDFWYKEIERGGPRLIEEFYLAMEKYPFDDFTKQIDDIVTGSGKAGIVVRNLGERLLDIQKDLQAGIDTTAKQDKLREEIFVAAMNASKVYQEALEDLDLTTGKVTIKEHELNLELGESTIRINTLTETLEKLKELREKPIITPPKLKGEPPGVEPAIVPAITDTEIEDVKERLTYMADQYKSYWRIVAQFGEEYVEEHNAQLAEDAKNYDKFLSDMLMEHGGVAELTKEIMLDIAEYNKGIIDKRKKAEEEYFSYIAGAREKELEGEENRFKAIIEEYKEGSDEYLELVERHNKNILEINEKYDKEIAEAKLIIFEEGLERQIGELDKNYKLRLEIAKKELGKETKLNEKYFEFVKNKLQEITKIEKREAKEKREILDSYFKSYQTTEEKIVSIHKRTAELLLLTDIKYERDRLKSIERQLVAEVRFGEARQEINDKIAEYGERLNNQELKEYIKFLEKMKIKYSEYADAILLLNEKIAESQKQIWENTRNEIDKTTALLHNLASIVGEFDTELAQMINNIANLISGVGQIISAFATGNIFGILGGIIGIVSSIFNLFVVHHSDVEEIEEELHEITLELQEQQNILNQAVGTAKLEAIQNVIDLLNEQISVYNEMIAAEEEAYGQFLWWTWSETDQANIEQWLSTIQNINAEIFNLQQQYREILTGTTAEAIADAIAEGFEQGLDSAQIFADTFNEMMKKAIMDAFKRTIITRYLQRWLYLFAHVSIGGLTAWDIEELARIFMSMMGDIESQWEAISAILAAAGIDIGPEDTEQIIEDIREIAGITEQSIADAIAGGFSEGLTSAEVFADTFNDMMRKAVINAFKEAILAKYIKDWYDQFDILYEGGLTTQEIQVLMGTYQDLINAAATEWETALAVLAAAGIELDEAKITGLTGAIAGITEETAGLLAGQFQAIRINIVDILSNMESIIIINSQIAENTTYNRYLESIDKKLGEGNSLESEYLRAIGG